MLSHNKTYQCGQPGSNQSMQRYAVLPCLNAVWLVQVLVEFAGQSFRILAMAAGMLHGVTAAELASLDQQQAEARCGPMDLLGMLVLSNHLRPSSRPTIAALQDRCARACDSDDNDNDYHHVQHHNRHTRDHIHKHNHKHKS